MDSDFILQYCIDNYEGIVLCNSYGERCIFYNPDMSLKRGVYVLTVKDKDGECDKSSALGRQGVYRVNLGISGDTFTKMFGAKPSRPAKGGIVDMPYDFSALDTVMPHPVYAWMNWICVLNPSDNTFLHLLPLIDEAYSLARAKCGKRMRT
ncbi:MAG: hypothetical protein K2M44_01060 [Clostridia bacterium]|nr:hypothetical protein [Clostridia bacterium]